MVEKNLTSTARDAIIFQERFLHLKQSFSFVRKAFLCVYKRRCGDYYYLYALIYETKIVAAET